MSRRRRQATRPRRTAPAPAPRRRTAWWWLALALAGAVWLAVSRGNRPPPSAPAAVHPAERMLPEEARQAGLVLGRGGRHLASLPYFRRAAEAMPSTWADRLNYASALGNAAQEGRIHLGKEEPAIRSSVERIAMAKLAVLHSGAAEGIAPTRADRATAASELARSLFTWGFPIDALEEYSRAGALDPGRPDIARAAATVRRLLETGGSGPE